LAIVGLSFVFNSIIFKAAGIMRKL
jgi:hypothetical protein